MADIKDFASVQAEQLAAAEAAVAAAVSTSNAYQAQAELFMVTGLDSDVTPGPGHAPNQ